MPDPAAVLDAAFLATLWALVVLHVLVYAAPLALVRFNALPWAFRVDFNVDLDFQTVTYATVHQGWAARLTHVTIPLEQVAWAALLFALHPAALVACTVLLGLFFARVEERPFSGYAFVAWLVVCAVAVALVQGLGAAAVVSPAQLLLLGAPLARVLGHALDPIPPWVGCERDAFLSLRESDLRGRMPLVAAAGWLSECAAALPFRLFWVQLFWGLQRFGYRPRALRSWSDAVQLGQRIQAEGWKAYPKTERLFAAVQPRA